MNVLADSLRYSRTANVLWRDTGHRVLVLPPHARGRVVVVGGGGAAIWRLLERSQSMGDLLRHFADGDAPDMATLQETLDVLVERGILTSAGSCHDERC